MASTAVITYEIFYHIGQQCQLIAMPYSVQFQVSIAINGTPAFCGGEVATVQTLNCYKLDNNTKTWVKVSCLKINL